MSISVLTRSVAIARPRVVAACVMAVGLSTTSLLRLGDKHSGSRREGEPRSEGLPPLINLPAAVDPFGDIEGIVPHVGAARLAYAESFTPEVRTFLIRQWATLNRFRGEEREFDVFLRMIEPMPVPGAEPPAEDQLYWNQERTVLTGALQAMWRGWVQVGPVERSAARVAGEAVRFSTHPDAMVRWQAGYLLGALDRVASREGGGGTRPEVRAALDRLLADGDRTAENLRTMLDLQLDHAESLARAPGS